MNAPTRILALSLGLVVLLALIDALQPTLAASGALDLPAAAVFAACAFAWVRADARERRIEAPKGSALLAALVIPIGVPVYLFRTLGFKRGSWATLKAIAFFGGAMLTYLAASYAVEFLMRR